MTKRVSLKSRIGGIRKGMPFECEKATPPKRTSPKSWKAKQRMWMLSGLRHLKAPVAS